jgi:hypothetical protein
VYLILAELTTLNYIYLALLAVSIGLAIHEANRDVDNDLQNEDPDTDVNHNARVPIVIGPALIGPVVLFEEVAEQGSASGGLDGPSSPGNDGKGNRSGSRPNDRQGYGLHALYVGPGGTLRRILSNNLVVWQGDITPQNAPSGSYVQAGDAGWFRIWWGDGFGGTYNQQFFSIELKNQAPFGANFRYAVVVEWDLATVGPTGRWPLFKYDVVGPVQTQLTASLPLIPKSYDGEQTTFEDERRNPDLPLYGFQPTDPFRFRILAMFISGDVYRGRHTGNTAPAGWFTADYRPFGGPGPLAGTPAAENDIVLLIHPDRILSSGNTSNPTSDASFELNVGQLLSLEGDGVEYHVRPDSSTRNLNFYGYGPIGEQGIVRIKKVEYISGFPTVTDGYNEFRREAHILPPGGPGTRGVLRVVCARFPVVRTGEIVDRVIVNPSDGFIYVRPMFVKEFRGANPAHALSQLMFSRWPHGRGSPQIFYDMNSLEAVALQVEPENYYASLSLGDKSTWKDGISRFMTDMGLSINFDWKSGKYVFTLHRQVNARVLIPRDIITEEGEEVFLMLPRSRVRVSFEFASQHRNYRQTAITFRDDAASVAANQVTQDERKIETTTSPISASIIGARRRIDEMGTQEVRELAVNRDGRRLYPGLPVDVEGDPRAYRVVRVVRDPLSSRVELELIVDPQADTNIARIGLNLLNDGEGNLNQEGLDAPGAIQIQAPVLDSDGTSSAAIVEIPRGILPFSGRPIVLPVAARTDARVRGWKVWLSRDGATYKSTKSLEPVWTAGTLASAWTPQDPPQEHLDEGSADWKVISIPGSTDTDLLEDLSEDPSWEDGRQIAIVYDPVAVRFEVLFVRLVDPAVEEDEFEMKGILRGKWGTVPRSFPAGSLVFVTRSHQIAGREIQDTIVQRGKPLFAKFQALTGAGAVRLDACSPVEIDTLLGLSVSGMPLPDEAGFFVHGTAGRELVGEDSDLDMDFETRNGSTLFLEPGSDAAPGFEGHYEATFWLTASPGDILGTLSFVGSGIGNGIDNTALQSVMTPPPSGLSFGFTTEIRHVVNGIPGPSEIVNWDWSNP